jgi:tRNA(adenine34) deaminase
MQKDIHWMRQALKLAERARKCDEVPVGAIVVLDDKIIGKGYNKPITANDPTAHAEIIALRAAAKKIGNYRLVNATLYVTLEPCIMCIGAMTHARIKRVVFGAYDPKKAKNKLNHKIQYTGEILAEDCGKLLTDFFRSKRKK